MKKLLTTLVVLLAVGMMPVAVYAADPEKAQPKPIPCVPSLPCLSAETQQSGVATREYITQSIGTSVMMTIVGLGAVASVIMIIYGGLQMHLAMGNEDTLGKAKKTVLWAAGGLFISTLAAAIVKIVSRINID